MLGRPRKNKRKDSDEPVKKKFGKTTRKGRKLKCSKNVGTSTTGTSVATPRTNVATSDLTNAAIGSQSSVNVGPSIATASTFCGRPTNTSSSNVRVATSSTSMDGLQMHQHLTTTTLRSGETLGYKRPRQKKKQRQKVMVSYLDEGVNSVTLSSSTPTNIDLGYKPNGLRWKNPHPLPDEYFWQPKSILPRLVGVVDVFSLTSIPQ
ncbi:hypothetical protein H5410_046107 [Solanum commersonii]|uniref:Uncharacterized protein n=1 Tax=Solanum commersonii TaxID=4109 RepID=A0A9J5XBD0_SOLCO|nr:hypothetical protein H5410_046107 [Solanum commersonii]